MKCHHSRSPVLQVRSAKCFGKILRRLPLLVQPSYVRGVWKERKERKQWSGKIWPWPWPRGFRLPFYDFKLPMVLLYFHMGPRPSPIALNTQILPTKGFGTRRNPDHRIFTSQHDLLPGSNRYLWLRERVSIPLSYSSTTQKKNKKNKICNTRNELDRRPLPQQHTIETERGGCRGREGK